MTENELVRYSRAGDAFHYRWAARRCLKMIYPNSPLTSVVIEGSKENEQAGEYVIDVAEYSNPIEDQPKSIAYFQLKHSTIRKEQPFRLSDLKDTIEGFAKRYSDIIIKESGNQELYKVSFSIVTNRPIAEYFKQNILDIRNGKRVNARFIRVFENYTKLNSSELQKFCALLNFIDGEGDYIAQRHQLHAEIARLLAGTADTPQIDSVVALVQEKALPNSDGRIIREDVLKRFNVTSERDLFPAPPEFENIKNVIRRNQHQDLLNHILNTTSPIIIKAAGGVGKSVFARQVVESLPFGSLGIVYDCFGGGRYRNRSETRHRHRDALVQIVNELAAQGLCDPLIAQSTALEDEILRKFLSRVRIAVESLRKSDKNALLVIMIDAADNAEMAAKELGQPCFAHELLREQVPEGCRLVMLSRTERVHLLQPNRITELELVPFSKEETLIHLRSRFPQATEYDGLEFHRLTSGNPRVQANSLSVTSLDLTEVLVRLGPTGTSIQQQIEMQLDSAILVVKERLSIDFQQNIDAICLGLATLPPLIPIRVLATAAEVDESTVKSFVADLGRPLWLSDTSVQFRDEPTETWFRERFSSTKDQIAFYIRRLEPLAYAYPYVAETLPSLLLQAEKYDELISLALSDTFLPQNNPIDERNIRIYRLQFAFRAALKLKRYADATRLALRAGEEVAGDKRQLSLLTRNVDLIAPLQNGQRVQELAFRRMLHGDWDGSENIYSAALLSSVKDFRGEARVYLRSGENWLNLFFEERRKNKKRYHENQIKVEDILELEFSHLNLFGVPDLVNSIQRWRPPEAVYKIAKLIIKRLIDAGNFEAVEEILGSDTRNQYLILAVAEELLEVGRFPDSKAADICIELLATKRIRIPIPKYNYGETIPSGLIAFIESCVARNLPQAIIMRVLRHYFPVRATSMVSSNYQTAERDTYLRALALRYVLSENFEPKLDDIIPMLLPEEIENDKTYRRSQDVQEFKEIVGGLLPWYIARARVLTNKTGNILDLIKDTEQRSKSARPNRYRDNDTIPFEISRITIEILTLNKGVGESEIEKLYNDYLKENQHIWVNDRLNAVRAAFRTKHLSSIRDQLEKSAYDVITTLIKEDPETKADWFISLARAVLPQKPDDAAAYFQYAIEAVSKFGDELRYRWEAVAALASRVAESSHTSPEMTYRFMRCAELIGDYVEFDYSEAIKICTKLSPVSALATISRWQDREVGYFYDQLPALAYEVVRSNNLSSSVGWSFSAYFRDYGLADYASLCIEGEPSKSRREYILNSAIRDLRLNEADLNSWQKLSQVIEKLDMENREVDDLVRFYSDKPKDEQNKTYSQVSYPRNKDEPEIIEWESVLGDLDLTTGAGISQALNRYNTSTTKIYDYQNFWREVFKRINESNASKFLTAIVESEAIERYDSLRAMDCFPDEWRMKASVKRYWPTFVNSLVRRYAADLTNHFTLENFRESLKIDDNLMLSVQESILEGLAENSSFNDASTYFNFVNTVCTFLSSQESFDLLGYALERFELHINDEFADGPWADWLNPPDDIRIAFTGFVWSSLGSPSAELRWRAAHSVRRLADLGCEREIDALMNWLESDPIGPFGSCEYPFYKLHACQYLFIALARVSLDNPYIIKPHQGVFTEYALERFPHILIQKFASEIALNIEKAFPGTYRKEIVEKLLQVGKSMLPIREIKNHNFEYQSTWKKKEKVDLKEKFYHGWDFDSYWFEPLGNVFGISREEVEELATEVIINEWGIKNDGSYESDPRVALWRSSRNEKDVWHDHGSYPHIDKYNFYLSYHSMLVVAAKLLQKFPVVHRCEWHEDEWSEWLNSHLLTLKDGRWLADRRDPAPLFQRKWIGVQEYTKNWRSELTIDDFLGGLIVENKGETWLNISGLWEEGDIGRVESFYITSALVLPTASHSLLNALSTCPNPNDFKLPNYQEENMEFKTSPFVLEGWIWRADTYNRLDEYDPLAGPIGYPPYQIGQFILDKMDLRPDPAERKWFLKDKDRESIICEIWSTNKPGRDKDPLRHGRRLCASLTFLKYLCSIMKSDLIFELQIDRRFKRESYIKDDDKDGYTSRFSKIFILSANGELRTTDANYQLRESTS
ncbi:MAG: hypothetical protein P4L50_09955 [Anaerolineaceae bacterium]|nr:hypothetical protein [Anaerolineaceae bacterium]